MARPKNLIVRLQNLELAIGAGLTNVKTFLRGVVIPY